MSPTAINGSFTNGSSTPPQLPGYSIVEQLYEGSQTIVYRAVETASQRPVVIKLLQQDYPSFNDLLQFRNQYAIAKDLDMAGIVRPYSLQACGNSYALVMEDFGGISLPQWRERQEGAQQPLLQDVLVIAVQLADILHELHHHRVIHKDIKPANILIHPETQQVKLIDFSIASLLPKETQEIQSFNTLEGTLAYLSPEQTGRMNRGIDYRSDFYSLGVTFFELLTGELPFQSFDPIELVHYHLAVQPPLAHTVNPEIPPILTAIIAKLMAKNAEDRYQSALGLKYDLERCWELWRQGDPIEFPLAERDLRDRFTLPERLYGREAEVIALLEAFNRVSAGTTELLLVAGFSGIGKTAVVNEVHKPIVRQRGYFIKGKYDQFNRNVPFSAFVQACRDLMAQLLSESDVELQTWKTQILQALGDSGQVIIEVIPELERIIGVQPPATELSGTAAQNRFNLLFQKFIQVFTLPAHPLVMFLDDMQWADSASLNLIQVLMAEAVSGYLLLIGAYRDNEVSLPHPLMLAIDAMGKAGATVNTMRLQPLSQPSLNQLVSDTLNCEMQLAQPLTELVYQKTQGNPFFATQFLKVLHQDQLISFDRQIGHWQCEIAQVREAALTDDVVEFMALQLKKFPQATQMVLKWAACIGAQFDLQTLAIASQQSESDSAADLWKAVQEGLILPQGEVYKFYLSELDAAQNTQPETIKYKFLHDRVQQAAYSLIPDDQKPHVHCTLGRLLLQNTTHVEQDEKLFDIVNHLNQGSSQLEAADILQLAQLNLFAGQKAKRSTAYEAGLLYFAAGIRCLPERWETAYSLSLSLHRESIECQYLAGQFEAAEESVATALQQCRSPLDQASIHAICLVQYQNNASYEKAIQVGLKSLKMLGLTLPIAPDQATIQATARAVNANQGDRAIGDLALLPPMEDPQQQMMILLLINLIPPTYLTNQELMVLVILEMMNLSLLHGNTPISSFAYLWYGTVLCAIFGEYTRGDRFGELGLDLLEQTNVFAIQGKAYTTFGSFISHWRRPLTEGVDWIKRSFQPALEAGELSWCFHGGLFIFWKKFILSDRLDSLAEEQQRLVDFAHKKEPPAAYALAIQHQVLANLQGKTQGQFSLDDDTFDETTALQVFGQTQYSYGMSSYYFAKAFLHFQYEEYAIAYQLGLESEKTHASLYGQFQIILHDFYQALSLAQLYNKVNEHNKVDAALQQDYFKKLQIYKKKFQVWTKNCPVNYQAFSSLLEAEISRIQQHYGQAIESYDRAIALAQKHKCVQKEALANELAAKFYLNWGKEKVAAGYMQEAYYCYALWGAKAKTDHLEACYPRLLRPILQQTDASLSILGTLATIAAPVYPLHADSREGSSSSSLNTMLDFSAILKASQALSGTIQLDNLLRQLTQIILQNSGADRCVLLLPDPQGEWLVQAIATLAETQLCSEPLDHHPNLPIKLIQYVKNTQATVLLDDLQTDLPIIEDYLIQQKPKSLLCLPIINQGNLVGILYLKNGSTRGVFTDDRILILNFLCTQAAISLENARLYDQAQQTLTALQQAQLQMIQGEKMSALGNLVAGVAHEINNPVGCIVGNVDAAQDYINDLLRVIDRYAEAFPNPGAELEDELEAIDLDYIREDLPQLIRAMKDGGDRIKSISHSLRTFSRSDSDVKQKFNVHEGIESTVLILRHRLKANDCRPDIEVMTDYGDFPELDCFPGQLNQVFMNILANAIDALDESNIEQSFTEIEANPNRIIICTALEENQVKITIADNGKGISDEIKNRIFDHLFTTKSVGKGTGLGLAIAQQIIVEKHGGAIEVNSEVGKGTEFILTLPLS
jgi:predicted ATPase/signal transduction histidine kinase